MLKLRKEEDLGLTKWVRVVLFDVSDTAFARGQARKEAEETVALMDTSCPRLARRRRLQRLHRQSPVQASPMTPLMGHVCVLPIATLGIGARGTRFTARCFVEHSQRADMVNELGSPLRKSRETWEMKLGFWSGAVLFRLILIPIVDSIIRLKLTRKWAFGSWQTNYGHGPRPRLCWPDGVIFFLEDSFLLGE